MSLQKPRDFIPGELESQKFAHRREAYYRGLETIKSLGYSVEDLLHHFPAFVGQMTLGRFLCLYEAYKATLGLAGHIAEVGVFRGASTLFFAKLTELFEPNSLTQVHGFDWFKGNQPSASEPGIVAGADSETVERVRSLISAQELQHCVRIHVLDVATEIEAFFSRFPHLQFKLVFLDAGMYEVVKAALPYFWERLNVGGYLILDQFNFEVAPGETKAVRDFLPDVQINSFTFGWMPSAYIIKPGRRFV
jgi:predicted O-methyltransferase YrrM